MAKSSKKTAKKVAPTAPPKKGAKGTKAMPFGFTAPKKKAS